jgi:tripartite-type tricarboxylate transporter receptor subunit TctC
MKNLRPVTAPAGRPAARRAILALGGALAVAAGLAGAPALAQPAWPAKPVTLVVPYPPGGATDVMARLYAEKLQARIGQSVIVDNRPGANTLVATRHVMQQPGDGYTIYFTSSAWSQGPVLFPKEFNYDIARDFSPISLMTVAPFVLVTNANVPARNIAEFIALAKSRPGQLNVATTGVGSTDHLAGELLANKAGLKFNFVPYKGGAAAVQDLLAGNADWRVDVIAIVKPNVEAGKLRALAIFGPPTPIMPDVPSLSDTVPGTDAYGFFGLIAPKGVPPALVERLNRETREIIALPDVQQRLRTMGMEPRATSPEEWREMAVKDAETWRQLIRNANIKIE